MYGHITSGVWHWMEQVKLLIENFRVRWFGTLNVKDLKVTSVDQAQNETLSFLCFLDCSIFYFMLT